MGRDHCVELGAFGAGHDVLNTERLKIGKHPRIAPLVCRAGHLMSGDNQGHEKATGHKFCRECRYVNKKRHFWKWALQRYFDAITANTNGFHCADCQAKALAAAA